MKVRRAYVLRVFRCRHSVIHAQRFQELLLQDNIVEPGDKRLYMNAGLTRPFCLRLESGGQSRFAPFLLEPLQSLQGLNELHHLVPLAVQDELPNVGVGPGEKPSDLAPAGPQARPSSLT